MIDISMERFFESISKVELSFPDSFNDRDFIHLYDFQKFFIHRTIGRIMELVKIKQLHYWTMNKRISNWQKLSECIFPE